MSHPDQTSQSAPAGSRRMNILRFSTAGSVDDGKSTLIGRLLHDSDNIYDDHLEALKKNSKLDRAKEGLSLALVTDGLKAEVEQGITIDVAYRYFTTRNRRFILADSPGHEQYTRNMATGASTADLTIVLIDARKGVVTQTKRHAFIASLMGVPRLLIAVNKMDLADYSEKVFLDIKFEFEEFAARLGVKQLRFIPVSALAGDNVVRKSEAMGWYHGETLLEYLENVYTGSDVNLVDFRFPVQYVLRPNQNYRGYAGQIASGILRTGDEVTILPSFKKSRIKSIDYCPRGIETRSIDEAHAPMSVVLTLQDEIDISRGDMIVRSQNLPPVHNQFEATLISMSEIGIKQGRQYIIKHTTRESKVFVDEIKYKIDVNTLSRKPGSELELNEIARVALTSTQPLMLDPYQKNRATGNFIIVDPETFQTIGAGMVIERMPAELLPVSHHEKEAGAVKSGNLHTEQGFVSREDRAKKYGFPALTIWMTGFSGSGKSTIAKELERQMFAEGRPVYRLDGDNLRQGLNKDLGFSKDERSENIRRVAEVAYLFNQAGITVICSFISPFIADRELAKTVIGSDAFVEVFLSTSLEVCEARDPHGLYRKARAGAIKDFTGVSSQYEVPHSPDIAVDTSAGTPEDSVKVVYDFIRGRS